MENILSYIWRYNILKGNKLQLIDGTAIEVVMPGCDNNRNLIFSDAVLRVDGTPTKMRVAIAPASPKDCDLYVTSRNEKIDEECYCMVIPFSEEIELLRRKLLSKYEDLPCSYSFKNLPSIFITDLISSLAIERLQEKSERIKEWLGIYNGDWEEVCYISIARSLGFGVNGNAFEALAKALPLKFLQKHADSLFQLEAMLFGVAGFLTEGVYPDNQYYKRLVNEFTFLKSKFTLSVNDIKQWRFGGMRPSNLPHQRIALLAALIHTSLPIFAKFIDADSEYKLRKVFEVYPSDYWEIHYTFGADTPPLRKTLGKTAVDLLIINSVAPLLYAYSEYIKRYEYATRAISLLEGCKSENNSIVRKFTDGGLPCDSALASQAFISLHNNYCTPRKCINCKIGYKLFKEEVKRVV